MPRFFRIISLLCIAAVITNAYYGFVDNNVYATKTCEPYVENPNYTSSNGIADHSRNLETIFDNDQTEDVLNEINSDTDPDELAKRYPDVRTGGWYTPPNGRARQRVAIIVPYRDRQQNLAIFLKFMHPYLMKQQIEYRVIVVEQEGKIRPFNRGKLLNVGFVESQKLGSWQCFISHDVDLLPLDPQIQYHCSTSPRHMSSAVKKYNITYAGYIGDSPNDGFGGVTAVTKEQFMKVNGYPNRYWGWGGEDNDLCKRLEIYYNVTQCSMSVSRCRYVMLTHSQSTRCPQRFYLLSDWHMKYRVDGLSSLNYIVTNITSHPLYTHIVANIDQRTLIDIRLRFIANFVG